MAVRWQSLSSTSCTLRFVGASLQRRSGCQVHYDRGGAKDAELRRQGGEAARHGHPCCLLLDAHSALQSPVTPVSAGAHKLYRADHTCPQLLSWKQKTCQNRACAAVRSSQATCHLACGRLVLTGHNDEPHNPTMTCIRTTHCVWNGASLACTCACLCAACSAPIPHRCACLRPLRTSQRAMTLPHGGMHTPSHCPLECNEAVLRTGCSAHRCATLHVSLLQPASALPLSHSGMPRG